jgi:hypothetical protein
LKPPPPPRAGFINEPPPYESTVPKLYVIPRAAGLLPGERAVAGLLVGEAGTERAALAVELIALPLPPVGPRLSLWDKAYTPLPTPP